MSLQREILSPVTTKHGSVDKRFLRKGKTYEEIYGSEKAKIIRIKHSQSLTGHPVSEETRLKLHQKLSGKFFLDKPWNKGLHGEEHWKHYKKGTVWNKGIPMRPESKEKLRKIKKGKKLTLEHRQNISLGVNKAYKTNPEYRNNISLGLIRKINSDPDWLRRTLLSNRKNHNTSIEKSLQNSLSALGVLYETHLLVKCGNRRWCFPDIVLTPVSLKIAIFADGLYWHNRPSQRARDEFVNSWLTNNGWIVLRFTDIQIKNQLEDCINKILDTYQFRVSRTVIPSVTHPGSTKEENSNSSVQIAMPKGCKDNEPCKDNESLHPGIMVSRSFFQQYTLTASKHPYVNTLVGQFDYLS